MLIRRLLHGAAVLVLLGLLAWLLGGRADSYTAAAVDLRGERWYRVLLHGRQVGHLHTETRRDALGRWRFDSELEFVLNPGERVLTREALLFDALPPYTLLRARQQTQRGGRTEGTLIERYGAGYRVARLPANEFRALELDYALADHLGFEAWLKDAAPEPGASRAVRALDFDRRQVVARQFRVLDRNAIGYRVVNAAPLEASTIQLDTRFRPVTMSLTGLFELELATRDAALETPSALGANGRPVPVNQPLPHHTEISALALEVEGPLPAALLWPEQTVAGTLYRTAGTVGTPRLLGDELTETANHPISNPRIRALARDAVAGASDPDARLAALTRFVHGYLTYTDDGVRRDVLTLLDEPLGDCNEYADLLTTLARALEIPSRTVFGLAYAADDPPAFRFHAWNELLVDGHWRAVDPTWNQLRIDATHIPLPPNLTYAMSLLTGGLDLRFTVRDVQYWNAPQP